MLRYNILVEVERGGGERGGGERGGGERGKRREGPKKGKVLTPQCSMCVQRSW